MRKAPPKVTAPIPRKVFDTNDRTTGKLAAVKAAGYDTIFRYLTTNTSSSKCVSPAEAHAIAAAGLRLGLVFEVWGGVDNFAHGDISGSSGTQHGGFVARYAPTVGAPPNTVIYFAIDTDATDAQIHSRVLPYFAAIRQVLAGKFRVGVYGCGAVCRAVLEAGYADKAWLSNAMGWNGSKAFKASGRAAMVQGLPKQVAGLDTDPDTIAHDPDIGDFVPFLAAFTKVPGRIPTLFPGERIKRDSVNVSAVGLVSGPNTISKIVAQELRGAGLTEAGIAGVLGNMKQESDFNPASREADQPRFGGEAHYAHGLVQMGGDEWNAFAAWLQKNHPGADWKATQLQVAFLIQELQHAYTHLWGLLTSTTDPQVAALAFSQSYERPSPQYANNAARQKWAQQYYDQREQLPGLSPPSISRASTGEQTMNTPTPTQPFSLPTFTPPDLSKVFSTVTAAFQQAGGTPNVDTITTAVHNMLQQHAASPAGGLSLPNVDFSSIEKELETIQGSPTLALALHLVGMIYPPAAPVTQLLPAALPLAEGVLKGIAQIRTAVQSGQPGSVGTSVGATLRAMADSVEKQFGPPLAS